jgi:hypothetical protein
MLGLCLGCLPGVAIGAVADVFCLCGPQAIVTYVLPAACMGIGTMFSCGTALPVLMATLVWPVIPVAGGAAIGAIGGFAFQLLGPDMVTNMCSGTIGACVVCMDSCLDCVSMMASGVLGPCTDMCSGMMGGAAMPELSGMGGGEAAAGGGMMDMCTGICPGM